MSNLATEGLLRKLKNVSILSLVMVLAGLTLTGCAGTSRLMTGSGYDAPIVVKYTVGNPLICEEVHEGDGAEFDYYYIKVSGLKDKEIEQKINDRIKAVYDGLRVQDIPPYRGIKTRIPEYFVLRNESIYVNVAGNFNNILSIVFNKNTFYQDPNTMEYEKDSKYYDSSRYYTEEETLNFDLNTGEEIELRDIFCDNVDYMKLVNDRMSSFLAANYADDEGYYVGTYGEIKQVESFKGLLEDQSFAVYPYGIAFVFDYRTPQFETAGTAVSPVLYYSEFGDNLALTKRFYKEDENIYVSEAPAVKVFAIKRVKNDIAGNEYDREGSVGIYQSWSYSSTLPEEIKRRLEDMRIVDRAKVDELIKVCGKLPSGTKDDPINQGAYEIMVYGDKTGTYYNIGKNTNIYLPQSGSMTSEYHCYDGETLRELRLEDIFRKDVDYRSVLGQAIRNAIEDGGYSGAPGSGELSKDYYAEALNGIGGFNLQNDSLLISVKDPASKDHSGSINLYIPYKDIGYENLNIFDE